MLQNALSFSLRSLFVFGKKVWRVVHSFLFGCFCAAAQFADDFPYPLANQQRRIWAAASLLLDNTPHFFPARCSKKAFSIHLLWAVGRCPTQGFVHSWTLVYVDPGPGS
ncbi:hypothetical protein BC939DRAFT_455155 [Gamsiella multidivaricata]|uniref:uncharacterized protein n=1 Tax=Gamsiella multidivaricata TaxID=101098 RepID=UPI00221E95FA|nr:uncharacterized protein BC939DRAFT_455155 [Gamsiella multidivaricata]KAI7821702.1 hypothetical protein BC939DRAFT_455155 [Gamsiella multidivaricata]